MGSTGYTQLTKTTFTGWANPISTDITLQQNVTSSGCYINVGDASKVIFLLINQSSVTDMYGWLEPSTWNWAGNQNAATNSSGISSATAWYGAVPFTVATAGVTPTSSGWTLGCNMQFLGPIETARFKSSAGNIYIRMSTANSTVNAVGVYILDGGSTN